MALPRIIIMGYECQKCGHKWAPRNKDKVPTICPKCKNDWSSPRAYKKPKLS